MTKNQLIKWVERKQADALTLVHEQYTKALTAHNASLHNELGLAELAASIQPLLTQADNLLMAWQEKWKEHNSITQYWDSLHNRLYTYTKDDNALYRVLCEQVDCSGTTEECKRLKQQKKDMEREVNNNYANVLRNLQALKNAKLGIEYLKELGFDVSEVIAIDQAPITTALAIPIDTRFLFLKEGS